VTVSTILFGSEPFAIYRPVIVVMTLCRTSRVALLAFLAVRLQMAFAGGLRGSLPVAPIAIVNEVAELSENDMPSLDLRQMLTSETKGSSFVQDSQVLSKMYQASLDLQMDDEDDFSEAHGGEEVDSDEAEDDVEPEENEDAEEVEPNEDENEDEEKDEDQDEDEDEGHESDDLEKNESLPALNTAQYQDHVQHLTRIGKLADSNHDNLLSHEELWDFAEKIKNQKRWDRTKFSFDQLDGNGDGSISHDELGDQLMMGKSSDVHRFKAADFDNDGSLNETELHFFSHPEVHSDVLQVEAEHLFKKFDEDKDGFVSFFEYVRDEEAEESFDLSSAWEDFSIYDADGSQDLGIGEFTSLLAGHDLLSSNIDKAIAAADSDGDGHIDLHKEVPNALHGLLNTEFIEDFFYHEPLRTEL